MIPQPPPSSTSDPSSKIPAHLLSDRAVITRTAALAAYLILRGHTPALIHKPGSKKFAFLFPETASRDLKVFTSGQARVEPREFEKVLGDVRAAWTRAYKYGQEDAK